ncbi:MAG: biotin/lipoyl-binding protein [Clostridia bacterium]|nr:biotin/lipoyl-binding protein [Clostridia bacterium]
MKKYNVKVNGEQFEVEVELMDSENGQPSVQPVFTETRRDSVSSASSVSASLSDAASPEAGVDIAVKAPVPGTVLRVNVKTGDAIKRGQCLLVLEAMKMENEIDAPEDGTVSIIRAGDGKSVAADEVLLYYRK